MNRILSSVFVELIMVALYCPRTYKCEDGMGDMT